MARGILVTWPHPLRWLRYFCKALLYGPDYSPYDELHEKYMAEYGLDGVGGTESSGDDSGSGQSSRKQLRLRQGSKLLDDGGGYTDREDESYYGL